MMVIMTHPLHGRLDVYSQAEVESNKLAGWVVEENAPETKYVEPVPGTAPAPEPEPSPEPVPAPKPARKSFFASADDSEV
jgi:hypothetical protein